MPLLGHHFRVAHTFRRAQCAHITSVPLFAARRTTVMRACRSSLLFSAVAADSITCDRATHASLVARTNAPLFIRANLARLFQAGSCLLITFTVSLYFCTLLAHTHTTPVAAWKGRERQISVGAISWQRKRAATTRCAHILQTDAGRGPRHTRSLIMHTLTFSRETRQIHLSDIPALRSTCQRRVSSANSHRDSRRRLRPFAY